jgi:hypothetical protein
MNFFKRIFGWSIRGKGKLKKRRHEHHNVDGGRNGSGVSLDANRESNSATSDTPSWPSPRMLMELGVRRAAASRETLSIAQSAKTRNDVIGTQKNSTAQATSNSDILMNPRSIYSEQTSPYHQSNIAVAGSLHPFSTIAPTPSDQLADEKFGGAYLSTLNSERIALTESEIPDGNAPLGLGHPGADQLRPTYNVTIHRRKVHAVTQFPSTSMHETPTRSSLSDSTTSGHSNSNSREPDADRVPAPLLPQSQSDIPCNLLKDSHLLQVLGNDAELLQALQLYYSKDPAKMFKNSPLRPELGPRSASEGDLNNRLSPTRASRSKSLDLDISAAPASDENSEDASILMPILQEATPVIPLNIQPRNNATRSIKFTSSTTFLSGLTNLQCRNTMGALPHRVLPQINTADLRLSSPALFDILFSNSLTPYNYDGFPTADPPTPLREITQNPPSVEISSSKSNTLSDDPTPLMDPEEDKENRPPARVYYEQVSSSSDAPPDAVPDRNQTKKIGSTHQLDIPSSSLPPSHGPIFRDLRSSLYASYASHMRSKPDEFAPANSQFPNRSPTKTLRSFVGSEIVDAYANMTAYGTDSEEEEMIESAVIATWESARLTSVVYSSPSDLLSPSSTLSPLSPTSTSELETPTVSLDRRRVSWSPESKKSHLTREDISTAIHVQNEASDAELLIRSSLDNDILVESSASPSPLISPPRPRNRRIFRPYSVSIAPSEYPSPHRGIVGLDGGSNREAFLYGTEDDETFTRKLDFRMASVDDGVSTAHKQRLPPGNTPRRVNGGVVRYSTPLNDIKKRKNYDVANRPFSPAASAHVDGEVETRRPRSHHKSPTKQTFSNKLGLSPNGCKSDGGVDVFGAVIHPQGGNHSPHRQISPARRRNSSTGYLSNPYVLATKSSISRIPRLRALEPDPGRSSALSSTMSVMSSPTRADIREPSPLRTFPRPKAGPRALRPSDQMAFGARIVADSRRFEPH